MPRPCIKPIRGVVNAFFMGRAQGPPNPRTGRALKLAAAPVRFISVLVMLQIKSGRGMLFPACHEECLYSRQNLIDRAAARGRDGALSPDTKPSEAWDKCTGRGEERNCPCMSHSTGQITFKQSKLHS
ncbi:hypothetical protein NDU88_005165 [Pleurodeles waltl]|uniref:Uncharacterized protein n=1 Tax=Pleurodeles waltl TaxID=8319 RepID=A0AAV7MVH4_PLEWA|nr:hypothetical protein NDU88_005165 [Pleurodeles waltl]